MGQGLETPCRLSRERVVCVTEREWHTCVDDERESASEGGGRKAQPQKQTSPKQTTDSDSKKEEIRFMEVLPVMLLYVTYDIINIT